MTPEQKAAFVVSQSVCAIAELESMKVENTIAAMRQEYPLHNALDFQRVISKYGLDSATVTDYLSSVNPFRATLTT